MHLDPFQLYWLQVFRWLWCQCFRVSHSCGFVSGIGTSSNKQTTITSEYANSFNTTNSYANSLTGGDTTLTLGGGTGSGTQPLDIVFVIGAIAAFFVGLFMLKGKD